MGGEVAPELSKEGQENANTRSSASEGLADTPRRKSSFASAADILVNAIRDQAHTAREAASLSALDQEKVESQLRFVPDSNAVSHKVALSNLVQMQTRATF